MSQLGEILDSTYFSIPLWLWVGSAVGILLLLAFATSLLRSSKKAPARSPHKAQKISPEVADPLGAEPASSGARSPSSRLRTSSTPAAERAEADPLPSAKRRTIYSPEELKFTTGRLEGKSRVATPGKDEAGYICFGPYIQLTTGRYRVVVRYASSADPTQRVAKWDVWNTDTSTAVSERSLIGTAGASFESVSEVTVLNEEMNHFEFRVAWPGGGEFTLIEVELEYL